MVCGSSVTTGSDSSAVLLGGEAVGRLAADKVGELVDCDASGGVLDVLVVWASFALLLANSLRLSFLRTGVGLTASCTAGENGEAIATEDSTDGGPGTPGVDVQTLEKGLIKSGFAGMSTFMSTDFIDPSALGVGDCRAGEVAGHGGAGGFIEVCTTSFIISATGASSISSTLGSATFGAASSSASAISTSTSGTGDGSFAGVNSFGRGTEAGSNVISIAVESSSGGDGGNGDGLFEETSFSAGDLPSTLIDAERIRSRCNLSSCACWRSLRLKDTGGFISVRGLAGAP